MNKENLIHDLIHTGKFMFDNNLAWGTAGNISARADGETFYISAGGTKLGNLKDHELVPFPADANLLKPSKEAPMHAAIYEQRPDIGAVVHSSPFYSTLLACSDISIPSNFFVETMYYLEKVEYVRYEHPGTMQLAEAVKEKARSANILLLKNHGVLVYEKNLDEALMALQTLEVASKMIVLTMGDKINIKGLSSEVTEDFLQNSKYKPRRIW